MVSFYLRLLIFVVPVAVLLGLPTGILYFTGEVTPIPEVLAKARRGPVLYGPAYVEVAAELKLEATKERQPCILVIGSSQALQIRGEFFHGCTFYNAGSPALHFRQLQTFLESVRPHYPRFIMLCVDSWWFNPNYPEEPPRPFKPLQLSDTVKRSWFEIWTDYAKGKIHRPSMKYVGLGQPIGLSAIEHGQGYRNDGSMRYGETLDSSLPWDPEFREYLQELDLGQDTSARHGQWYSAERIKYLSEFLAFCRAHNIHVAGILNPYPSAILARLHRIDFQYMWTFEDALQAAFASQGFQLADAHMADRFGCKDDEFINGNHASEVCYARILSRMAEQGLQLHEYVDAEALQRVVARRKSALDLGLDDRSANAQSAQF